MVIIDSDGGADDASALILLMEQSNLQIVAITCTYGNVHLDQACDNVRRTLELMGKANDIPVYAGCDKPIIGDIAFDYFFGVDGFGNNSQKFPLPSEDVQPEHASNAIVNYVNQYPGQIALVALGPLTNLAVALKLDCNLSDKLKRLHVMGGTSSARGNMSPVAEFNFYADPVAANAVINGLQCPISLSPYELCVEYSASWAWYDQWVSSNTTIAYFIDQTYAIANENAKANNGTYANCDLQAATIFVYPETVLSSTLNHVDIETCGTLTYGQSVVDYRPNSGNPNAEIYIELDGQLMLEKWSLMVNYTTVQKSKEKPFYIWGIL